MLVWHHKRSKHTLQTSNCGTREFHKQELVPAQLLGGAVVQVSAVVHTGQRGQVFSRVSTNCRVGFFNADIDTYEGFVCKPPNFKLETNWFKTPFCKEQRSRFQYCVFITHYQCQNWGTLQQSSWLLAGGSGPGRRYKTLYFPIPTVALQLLWSVM